MKHVHVIPVPEGMTVDEAWAEITIMGRLVHRPPADPKEWAVIECDGNECSQIERASDVKQE